MLAVWLYLCIRGPITFRCNLSGRNARNWPEVFFPGKGVGCPVAVWALEAYEAQRILGCTAPCSITGATQSRITSCTREVSRS